MLRVLIADFNADRSAALRRHLAGCADIAVAYTAREHLRDAVARQSADVVIACLGAPDAVALDELRQVFADHPLPIVLFVEDDDPALMEAAIAAGVSSYHVVGSALPEISPIVRSAIALFRRQRQLAEELAAARTSLAESTIIDMAKARLIRRHSISEPEAYRRLRRGAMNQGRRIVDIARNILASE